jgi:hypothetical protein
MRAIRSPRPRSCSVRASALAAAVTALMTGMTAGLWPPGAADASAVAVAGPAGSWGRAIEVPGLAALNTSGLAEVTSVSCGSAGNCAAGGDYFIRDVQPGRQGFVAVERNGVWGPAVEVPGLAALNTGEQAQVYSVSCGSAGSCAAGGYYADGDGALQGFVAAEQNGVWGTAIAVPGLAALNTGGDAEVFSVSCGSAGNCAAGGKYRGGAMHRQGFVVSEKNGRWGRAIEVPGLAALHKRGGDATVISVSCASAGNCAAGGSYHLRHHHQGFVAVERNGRWGKAIEVPGLAALNTGGQAIVNAVSCASAGNCAAGGDYTHWGGQGFVAVEKNGRWGEAIGVPGLAALNTGGFAEVLSVSCGSAGNCAAGGDYVDQHRNNQGFVVSEKNGRWGRAIEVPGLGALNKGGYAYVGSVSCASAGNCAAGGQYIPPSGLEGFVTVERGNRWGTAIEVPGLAALNQGGNAGVYSVSCAPAGTCAAGGPYTDRHGNEEGFVVSQTG